MKPDQSPRDVEGLDAFEKRLMRVPLRGAPEGIQATVLAGARDGRVGRAREVERRSAGRVWTGWLRELIWPNPKAWGCLAIGWVVIAVAQLSLLSTAHPKTREMARSAKTHPVDPELIQRVREQREMLARLLSPPVSAPATRGPKLGPQILYWKVRQRGNLENFV